MNNYLYLVLLRTMLDLVCISVLSKCLVGEQGSGPTSGLDRAVAMSAGWLEEAWAWGFDVDVWRAHLNALTWPEVCAPPALM